MTTRASPAIVASPSPPSSTVGMDHVGGSESNNDSGSVVLGAIFPRSLEEPVGTAGSSPSSLLSSGPCQPMTTITAEAAEPSATTLDTFPEVAAAATASSLQATRDIDSDIPNVAPNVNDAAALIRRFGSEFHNEAAAAAIIDATAAIADAAESVTATDLSFVSIAEEDADVYKPGHLCCGGCCDMRLAVIIVDTLYVIYAVLMLLLHQSARDGCPGMGGAIMLNCDYDEIFWVAYRTSGSDGDDGYRYSKNLIHWISAVRLLSSTLGLVGALCFQPGLVAIAMLPHWVDIYFAFFVLDLSLLLWVLLVSLSLLLVYPHVFFVKEALRDGTMTRTRYQPQGCCFDYQH